MRAMRILVMFDLPTNTKQEKKKYALFRKFLLGDGFRMEQYSVYSRVTLGRDNMNTHIARIRENLPDIGSVTVLTLTEKQYEDRLILLERPLGNSEDDPGAQLTLFF